MARKQKKPEKIIKKEILEHLIEKKESEEKPEKDLQEDSNEDQQDFSKTEFIKPSNKKPSLFLEENISQTDNENSENLEESLARIETPKKKEDSKEFYNQTSYAGNENSEKQKYESPAHNERMVEKRNETKFLTAGEIRFSQPTTAFVPEVKSETQKYSTEKKEHYNSSRVDTFDPHDINPRKRNDNPQLENANVQRYQ